jgi:hypothetical protein
MYYAKTQIILLMPSAFLYLINKAKNVIFYGTTILLVRSMQQ